MTWCAGIDVLSFGTTRNGTWAGDAIIFFDPERAQVFDRLAHRSGHCPDKSDFIGAQLVAVLDDGVWLRNAYTANTMAARLAAGLQSLPHIETLFPVETNVVFLRMPPTVLDTLKHQGVRYALRPDLGPECIRLTCSFATTEQDVDAVVRVIEQSARVLLPC